MALSSTEPVLADFGQSRTVRATVTPLFMDRDAFSAHVRTHHRAFIAYAAAITGSADTAKDIVQDACVTAYQSLGKFDVSRDFPAWMRGIVRNKCRDAARKKQLTFLDDDELEAIEADHISWSPLVEGNPGSDLFDALTECTRSLPDTLRSAIDRFYYRGDSTSEAAEALDTSESSLRKRLQRAREQLRSCLTLKAEPTA